MAITPQANPKPVTGSKFSDSDATLKKSFTQPGSAVLLLVIAVIAGAAYWFASQQPAQQPLALDALTNPDSDLLQQRINDKLFGDKLLDAPGIGADIDNTIDPAAMGAKLAGLTKNVTTQNLPTADELQQFYQRNKANYRNPSKFWFTVVTYTTAKHGGQAFQQAEQALEKALEINQSSLPGLPKGDLTDHYGGILTSELETIYGQGFVDNLMQVTIEATIQATSQTAESSSSNRLPCWYGPISSPQGANLICVDNVVWGDYPALESVQDQVINDWRFAVSQ
jgi:hypothetical protein